MDVNVLFVYLRMMTVNTPAAELLYTSISDLCKVSASSTLVDVCCGTGTIGLTLAKVHLLFHVTEWKINQKCAENKTRTSRSLLLKTCRLLMYKT